MENANKTYDLKVEKMISKTPAEVFRAIGEGRLFENCSADHDTMKIDFKVGGKYMIQFLNYDMKNQGEFLEIVPNQKITFTWCQDYNSNPTPDTKVSIELKDVGGKTALTLTHTGFNDIESRDDHKGGWTGGLDDLSEEIINGKLRLMRKVPLTIEQLFETCKNSSDFKGKVLESAPNQKIILSLNDDSKLSLLFDTEDEKSSWLEVIHEGLKTEAQQKTYRAKWDSVLKQMMH
jgi:uncharacterized protein YndB with AHSA1/START domain